jgi:hypothetical protein
MPNSKNLQIEDVEDDTEENLRITKRKKRYPGGKIFAPGLVSNELFNFVCEKYLKKLEEIEENEFEEGWEEFVNGLV